MKYVVLNVMARCLNCQCSVKYRAKQGKKRRKSKQANRLAHENAEVCLRLVNECHLKKQSPVAEFRANRLNQCNNLNHNNKHADQNTHKPPSDIYRQDNFRAHGESFTDISHNTSFMDMSSTQDLRRLTVMEEILKYLKIMVAKRDEDDAENDVINEWQQVAMVMDRFLFWFFLSVTIFATMIMMVIIPIVRSYTAMEQGEGI